MSDKRFSLWQVSKSDGTKKQGPIGHRPKGQKDEEMMKKIQDGLKYDTETETLVAEDCNGYDRSNYNY